WHPPHRLSHLHSSRLPCPLEQCRKNLGLPLPWFPIRPRRRSARRPRRRPTLQNQSRYRQKQTQTSAEETLSRYSHREKIKTRQIIRRHIAPTCATSRRSL